VPVAAETMGATVPVAAETTGGRELVAVAATGAAVVVTGAAALVTGAAALVAGGTAGARALVAPPVLEAGAACVLVAGLATGAEVAADVTVETVEAGGGVVAELGAVDAEVAGAAVGGGLLAGAAVGGGVATGVAAPVAAWAADVTVEVVDVTSEVSVLATEIAADPDVAVAALGAVAAWACRENASKTTRIPAARIANCAARRATRRKACCGIRGLRPQGDWPDTTAHL
jgi:hypothetical protein